MYIRPTPLKLLLSINDRIQRLGRTMGIYFVFVETKMISYQKQFTKTHTVRAGNLGHIDYLIWKGRENVH
jgi:hypothetical protein